MSATGLQFFKPNFSPPREVEQRRQQETKEQPAKKKTRRQRNQRRASATESGQWWHARIGFFYKGFFSGLRIRSIFGRIRFRILPIRILKSDPDAGARILLALKESIQTSTFFFTSNTFLLIFEWWLVLSEKKEKFTWKCVKPLI